MRMTRQQLSIECDMLQGNVNRMMVTNDRKELREMYYYASVRLATILKENEERLKGELNE